ncbi:MAG: serine hydrolase domain-containing protein [Phycisphaerales bacterium]
MTKPGRLAAWVLVVASLGCVPVVAQTTVVSTPAVETVDHAAACRALVTKVVKEQHLVGISAIIAKDGKPVFEEHQGFEDREAGVKAGAQTMYRWASISKPVTATLVMMLIQANKFDLDADIRSLVPEFPQQPNGWVVTPRQLLGHLGGVVHYSNGKVVKLPVPEKPEHPYEDVVKALDTFKESPLLFEPGTKYSYTTHGYMLLAAAVQRASGEKFATLAQHWVADGASMTTFQPDYQWKKIEHRAAGYRKGKDGEMERSTDTDVSWKLGGGGFISTVADLSHFSVALMEGQLVSPESFKLMCTPQKTKDGKATTYGMGLGVGKLGDKPTASHSGSQEKTATMMLMVPDDHLTVAIMSNTEGASLGRLADELAAEWLGVELTPAKAKPAKKPDAEPKPAK